MLLSCMAGIRSDTLSLSALVKLVPQRWISTGTIAQQRHCVGLPTVSWRLEPQHLRQRLELLLRHCRPDLFRGDRKRHPVDQEDGVDIGTAVVLVWRADLIPILRNEIIVVGHKQE